MGNERNNLIETAGTSHVAAQSIENAGVVAKSEIKEASAEPPLKRVKLETDDGSSSGSNAGSSTVMQTSIVEPQATESKVPIVSQPAVQPAGGLQPTVKKDPASVATEKAPPAHNKTGPTVAPIVTPSPAPPAESSESKNSSASSLHATSTDLGTKTASHPTIQAPVAAPEKTALDGAATVTKEPPLKSTTMSHLKAKYTAELEYMLREFRKLERQLLGAKGAAQLEESAGSRERREKLHSFILHLEDTVRQIETGCKLEAEGKSTIGCTTTSSGSPQEGAESAEAKKQMAESSALTNLTKEKEEEENVQKLEEHILANLLPVKVRLKKQLAAQQGASRNPAGMPAPRRGMLQPAHAERGQGTFAAAAEQRRKQAEAARLAAQQEEEQAVRRVSDPTQFGKPLGGGGSSLTQKLHGQTLGSKQRPHGSGVGRPQQPEGTSPEAKSEKQILYAGMVPGSSQHKSGVQAASGVHEMVIGDTQLPKDTKETKPATAVVPSSTEINTKGSSSTPIARQDKISVESRRQIPEEAPRTQSKPQSAPRAQPASTKIPSKVGGEAAPTEEEKRKLRKKRRKRKLLRLKKRRERERQRQAALHQQTQATQLSSKGSAGKKKSAAGKGQGKKKGPRSVEYICALCSEAYTSTCEYNPWWALAQHECPKCRKSQIPRIDITSPANAIEYHPALLAHADDNGNGGASAATSIIHVEQPAAISPAPFTSKPMSNAPPEFSGSGATSDSESDLSELSDDSLSACSSDSEGSAADLQSMTAAEQAEHESFGHEYKGPVLSDYHAGRLLILMAHASTCPCRHKISSHRDVCTSTKYMMLHVRDCPGTTSTFDVCPYPWCRKVKHLLYHLVSCTDPEGCKICTPEDLSVGMGALVGLNSFRLEKYRERLIAATKAAASGRSKGISVPQRASHNTAQQSAASQQSTNRKAATSSKSTASAKASASAPRGASSSHAPIARQPPPVKERGVAKESSKQRQVFESKAKPSDVAKVCARVSENVAMKPNQSHPVPTTTLASAATLQSPRLTVSKTTDVGTAKVHPVPMVVDCSAVATADKVARASPAVVQALAQATNQKIEAVPPPTAAIPIAKPAQTAATTPVSAPIPIVPAAPTTHVSAASAATPAIPHAIITSVKIEAGTTPLAPVSTLAPATPLAPAAPHATRQVAEPRPPNASGGAVQVAQDSAKVAVNAAPPVRAPSQPSTITVPPTVVALPPNPVVPLVPIAQAPTVSTTAAVAKVKIPAATTAGPKIATKATIAVSQTAPVAVPPPSQAVIAPTATVSVSPSPVTQATTGVANAALQAANGTTVARVSAPAQVTAPPAAVKTEETQAGSSQSLSVHSQAKETPPVQNVAAVGSEQKASTSEGHQIATLKTDGVETRGAVDSQETGVNAAAGTSVGVATTRAPAPVKQEDLVAPTASVQVQATNIDQPTPQVAKAIVRAEPAVPGSQGSGQVLTQSVTAPAPSKSGADQASMVAGSIGATTTPIKTEGTAQPQLYPVPKLAPLQPIAPAPSTNQKLPAAGVVQTPAVAEGGTAPRAKAGATATAPVDAQEVSTTTAASQTAGTHGGVAASGAEQPAGNLQSTGSAVKLERPGGASPHNHREVEKTAEIVKVN